MAIVTDNKCPRCDKHFSGLKRKCPYCGAKAGKKVKRSTKSDNATGRMIIALLLIFVLVGATVAVVYTSINDRVKADSQKTLSYDDDEGVTSVKGTKGDKKAPDTSVNAEITQPEPEEQVPVEQPELIKVEIICFGSPTNDFTTDVGYSFPLSYRTTPDISDPYVIWKSGDENVFTIDDTGNFTAVGHGTATLTLTVNGFSVESVVRVN